MRAHLFPDFLLRKSQEEIRLSCTPFYAQLKFKYGPLVPSYEVPSVDNEGHTPAVYFMQAGEHAWSYRLLNRPKNISGYGCYLLTVVPFLSLLSWASLYYSKNRTGRPLCQDKAPSPNGKEINLADSQ